MPKGKKWTEEEFATLAQAWIQTSEEVDQKVLKGTGQTLTAYWEKVLKRFKMLAPADPEGRYHLRGLLPVMNQWKDLLSRNVKKFNKCLVRVLKAKPTGVTEDQKVNMAIAIHLGKIDTMSYRYKDFKPNDWKYHQAWLVLRHHPAFLPPPVPTPANTENLASDDSDEDDTDDSSAAAARKKKKKKMPAEIKAVSSASVCEVSVPSVAQKNRGPGLGRMKTKQMAEQTAYRDKKTQIIEQLVELQKQRLNCFDTYVNNQARLGAFQMCALSFKMHRDTNPERASYFADRMNEIMEPEPRQEEEFNLDFDMNEEVPVHEKCPDMMPLLPLPKKATRPHSIAIEKAPPKASAFACRLNDPDDENESSSEEEKTPPRRSNRGAPVSKKAVVNKKRGRAKRAEV